MTDLAPGRAARPELQLQAAPAEDPTAPEVAAVAAVLAGVGAAVETEGERLVRGGWHRSVERRHLLLPGLLALQRARGWVSRGGLTHLCRQLGVPEADGYGVATFYDLLSVTELPPVTVRVCVDAACRINGFDGVDAALDAAGLADAHRIDSPCLGQCDHGGAALVTEIGAPPRVVRRSAAAASPAVVGPAHRGLLWRIGEVPPDDLAAYHEAGGYTALARAVSLGPDAVIEEITRAGLRGRGGAAFPTGVKWRAVADEPGPRHVVANADESEPGTFKDRVVMEGDPFALVEGLTIAGFATGATQGWIYLRGEYPVAARRLTAAIDAARAEGLLGTDVLDAGFDFDIELRLGGGAYICGEETAIFNSIEGFRGEPRQKPPFPTTHGLFGRPTAVNNVETLIDVNLILNDGVEAFRAQGTDDSSGPRLFCVSGRIARPGVYEHPHGVTLSEVMAAAGGIPGGRPLRAVLMGGAAGSFVGPDQVDVPLTFEDSRAAGFTLGSGVVMVFDDTVDLTDVVGRLADFFAHESCGQCVPCRVGTRRQADALRLGVTDRELYDDLAAVMGDASICGLGHTASSAVQSALRLGLLEGVR